MVRHYKQDISPQRQPALEPEELRADPVPARSLRDLRPSPARVRLQTPREAQEFRDLPPRHRKSRWGVWIAASIALLVLLGAGAFILFPSTNITIVPRTHTLQFDATNPLTAYPSASAAPGTIAYTPVTETLEESTSVAASGTETVEEKATGNVTVYNSYSDKPVRLIKNTRFQSPDGLIFRIPASVDVPGKTGDVPGTIQVTVFADGTGPSYNIAPTDKFTLPGLKSTADMYANVYAKSTTAFSGGFSGERPAVTPAVLEAAKAEIRARLNEKAQQAVRAVQGDVITFPGLVAITFESLPPITEGTGVRIREKATLSIATFPAGQFAQSLAQSVSADAEGQSIRVEFSDGTMGEVVGTLSSFDLVDKPLTFVLKGTGRLTWNIDANAVAQALVGREEAAFKSIIEGFLSVEEARARITPFWRKSFPKTADSITVIVENPAAL